MSYLNGDGLATLWSKIKRYVDAKIVGDIPDNSITEGKLDTAVKNKLNAFTNTAVSTTTTIADIVTEATGYSVTQAQYASWGKIAMVRLVVKKDASAGSGTQTICTLVSGKRPVYVAPGNCGYSSNCAIGTGGGVVVSQNVAANATLQIRAIYILA